MSGLYTSQAGGAFVVWVLVIGTAVYASRGDSGRHSERAANLFIVVGGVVFPGVYRGVCTEYCGTSHALMAFQAVVQEPEDFTDWMERQRAPAAPPGVKPGVHMPAFGMLPEADLQALAAYLDGLE